MKSHKNINSRKNGLSFFVFVLTTAMLMGLNASANVCVTESRGLYFFDTNWDVNYSSRAVVGQCQSNTFTSNHECAAGLRCADHLPLPYPSGQIQCNTQSRGIGFENRGYAGAINTVTSEVVGDCTRNPYTTNSECLENLRCFDAWSNPPLGRALCSTQSRSLIFRNIFRNENEGSQAVISMCLRNPYTLNSECQANISCFSPFNGSIAPGPTYCNTASRGIQFQSSGLDINQASQGTVGQCHNNPYTINSECVQNLWCRIPDIIDGSFPGPVSCWVTTSHGRYQGFGPNAPAATAHARDQCLRSWGENSFSCNAGSVVCRQQ